MARRKKYSQYLRNNMSKPEVLLWLRLQNDQIGYRIHRQFPVGPYIVDFYCRQLHVAIEIDGSDHAYKAESDAIRDDYLLDRGISTLRIPAKMVLRSPEHAAQIIREHLDRFKASIEPTDGDVSQ